MGGEGNFGTAMGPRSSNSEDRESRAQLASVGCGGKGGTAPWVTHVWDAANRKKKLCFLHAPGCLERFRENLWSRFSQGGVPGPAATALPGSRLEMHASHPTLDPLNQTLRARPMVCILASLPGDLMHTGV